MASEVTINVITEECEFAGRTFRVVDPRSLKLPYDTSDFRDIEPILHRLEKIKPGEVFIDVGARFGTYALRALAMGAFVMAFEPTELPSEVLRMSVEYNAWGERFLLHRIALYDGTEIPETLHREVFEQHYPSVGHSFTTLDTALDGNDVQWLKLDVEGFELGVLQGAIETLRRWHPQLLIEDHDNINPGKGCVVSDYPASIDSSRRILTMLREIGYQPEIVPWDCGRRYIVADRF